MAGEEWQLMEQQFELLHPENLRTHQALRKKFVEMYSHQRPTRDPYMPPEIWEAKEILRLIESRADAVNMDRYDKREFGIIEIESSDEDNLEDDNKGTGVVVKTKRWKENLAQPMVRS